MLAIRMLRRGSVSIGDQMIFYPISELFLIQILTSDQLLHSTLSESDDFEIYEIRALPESDDFSTKT